jgi:hypothetical protein
LTGRGAAYQNEIKTKKCLSFQALCGALTAETSDVGNAVVEIFVQRSVEQNI